MKLSSIIVNSRITTWCSSAHPHVSERNLLSATPSHLVRFYVTFDPSLGVLFFQLSMLMLSGLIASYIAVQLIV